MSDLISRSELLSTISNMNFDFGNDTDNTETIIEMVSEVIKEQPTVYDIDKVVEEFEQKKEEVQRMRNTCVALSDLEVCDIENVTYERAIEIVKQGGVSDVVCEWKKSKDYPFDWLVGCDGCEVNHRQGDYCPRCGKKIKVLE